MTRLSITRRQALASAAALGTLAATARGARAAKPFAPPASLTDAAKKEGRLVLYTATFTEVAQETINTFNKTFPSIRVDLVRASGGQLITRVQSEAAAGKLIADIVEHSDRGQLKALEDLFADYAPPNAADYLPAALVSPKLWPTNTPGWCIAYNSELAKNPPKSWMDLTKPEYGNGQIGQVIGPSGGTTWTRIMFERQVLGEDYWQKPAATKPRLYPSGAPLSDSLVRGEVSIAPLIFNVVFPKQRDGAPLGAFFPPEGIPIVPYATGIPKTAKHPNAGKLFLDWMLSDEGQAYSIAGQGNLTSLKEPPAQLPGYDPKVSKVWVPDFKDFVTLHAAWMADWNKVYGYRQ
jgi:iron(III) transport system substrate-binding protein